jgi:hypothetical protein
MINKKSIQVKGIKNLEKSEMQNAQAGGCGYIDPEIWIHCTDSFTIIYGQEKASMPDIIANNFIAM